MAQQLFARALHDGSWQWKVHDSESGWIDHHYYSGDVDALVQALPKSNAAVHLILAGQQVIANQTSLDEKQKRHAAKLIPYELEDDIVSGVDAMHFAYTVAEGGETKVLYADNSIWSPPLQTLLSQGCDVHTVLPDYLSLKVPESGVTILLENGVLIVRSSCFDGFSIEQSLAPIVLKQLFEQDFAVDAEPIHIHLFAELESQLNELKQYLPELVLNLENVTVHAELGHFWDLLEPELSAKALNFRRGRFGRQLPIKKWWQSWRIPTMYLAVAFACALFVQLGLYWEAKSQEKVILEQMNDVYQKAVPNGRKGDPEGVLTSMLRGVNSGAVEPSNFIFLLSKVTEALDRQENASLSSYSYSSDQKSLQLTLEFAALGDIGDFRVMLEKLGIEADSPRTNSTGSAYQARMKVTEAAQ